MNSTGDPDAARAHDLRQRVLRDGQISRSPTPAEMAFLMYLHKERGYGKGFPVE